MALMPQPGSKLKTSTTKRPDAAFENWTCYNCREAGAVTTCAYTWLFLLTSASWMFSTQVKWNHHFKGWREKHIQNHKPRTHTHHTHTLIIQNIKTPVMVVPRKIPGKHPAAVLISHQSPTPSPDRGGTWAKNWSQRANLGNQNTSLSNSMPGRLFVVEFPWLCSTPKKRHNMLNHYGLLN